MENITNLAIKSADGIVLLYSCTSSMSFADLDTYIAQIRSNNPSAVAKMVVGGTNCVEEDDRAITTEQGRAKCQELGVPFFECSAKANINIAPMFEECVRLILPADVKAGKKKSAPKGDGGSCNVS
jgi:GTPase SAR1 family protein